MREMKFSERSNEFKCFNLENWEGNVFSLFLRNEAVLSDVNK